MLRAVAVLVVLGVMIYAFVDCSRSDEHELRLWSRAAWLLVICVPLVGAVLYLWLGRPRGDAEPPVVRPLAPDDDPEFLRKLDAERRRRLADEQRRRRREERAREQRPREAGGGPPTEGPPETKEGHEQGDGEDHSGHPA